jgi:DNA (cytosine-5)-methyltransferase 1
LAFSEIEPFPRKVLTHHYPDVRLEGDFTKLREQDWIKDADILVGGTPCQAFSVAGLRNSLDDDRGNLTLEFVRLANAIDDLRFSGGKPASIIVWENVPGVLSVKDNAFGCFLGAIVGNDAPLIPTGGKWTNAGMVMGPTRRAAWRVLDAQYFGLAQRRRRVFVVASARDGIDPAEVLFEREGLRRNTPPCRETGQRIAELFETSAGIGGDEKTIEQYTEEVSDTILAKNNQTFGRESPSIVAQTINARMGSGGFDIKTETPIIVGTLGARTGLSRGVQDAEVGHLMVTQPIALAENIIGRKPENGGNGDGFIDGGPMYTLNATGVHGVAQPIPFGVGENPDLGHCLRSGASKADKHESTTYVAQPYSIMPMNSGKDYKAREVDVAQPVMAAGPTGGNQGGDYIVQPMATHEIANTMISHNGGGGWSNSIDHAASGYMAIQQMAVRRLTPRECERLQGFPDDYTAIPGAADGPRYKALGNSMAVPVMNWLGKRIRYQDTAKKGKIVGVKSCIQ